MVKTTPYLQIFLDFGGSGTKIIARLDGEKSIYFLMPPHCSEISLAECSGDHFDENSVWFGYDSTRYAVGILAEQASGSSIKIKKLKVESAPLKTLAAIVTAMQKFGLSKKINLSLWIVLPSGEIKQSSIFENELRELLDQKLISPWGQLQVKLRLFKVEAEGKGILLYHRQKVNVIKNTLILMLGYRNASFILTQGKAITSKSCSDIGFHVFLNKLVSLTSGYSIEKLLVPVSLYRIEDNKSALNSVLRFSIDSPHRQQELVDLKAAIIEAEKFYIQQLLSWLDEFLSVNVDEIVLAGGSASYIWSDLCEKLIGRVVTSGDHIHVYDEDNLPPEIAKIKNGERFLDVCGIHQEVNRI
jgi:hypothetical protein